MNTDKGAAKSRQTQIEKYGGKRAYRKEMSRRAKLRKINIGGAFNDPEKAREAARKSAEVRSKRSEHSD